MTFTIYEILDRQLCFQVFKKENILKFDELPLEELDKAKVQFWDFFGSNAIMCTKELNYPNTLKHIGYLDNKRGLVLMDKERMKNDKL